METKRRFRGVTAVFLPVRDLDRSIEWYSNIMGFKLIQKLEEYKAASMDIGARPGLCLVQADPFEPMRFPKNNFFVHIYFNYSAEDIDQTHAELVDKGVKVTDIEEGDGGFKHFSLQDIDGNWISVVND